MNLTIERVLLQQPEPKPPEYWYIAKDETGEPVAQERLFLDFIITLVHYLERNLERNPHGR